MKKILLIGINARYTHSNLALLYLEKYIKHLDYTISIQEFSINTDIQTVIGSIHKEHPLIIGMSVYIWNEEYIKKLLALLPGSRYTIILGGPEVSFNPETWFNLFPCIDHIVIGPGEQGLLSLLEMKQTPPQIINIENTHFSNIPNPYSRNDILLRKNKYIYYESSRGCPFSCSYCLSASDSQMYEYKLLSTVKEELELIISCSPRLVKFIDRTFNAKKSHYREIWKFLINNYKTSSTSFHFEIFPELLDQGDFQLLADCPPGFFQFEIGIQSTDNNTLESIQRITDWSKAKNNIVCLCSLGTIHIHLDMIVGLPYSDYEKTVTTFNEIYSLKPDHFQVGFLKVLPGTSLFAQSKILGLVYNESAPYEIISNNWLLKTDISQFKHIAFLVDLLYNKGSYKTCFDALHKCFSNAFALYASFVEFLENSMPGFFTQSNTFDTVARFLLSYTKQTISDKSAYILDCLRWDYCQTSKIHRYPQSLCYTDNKQLKKELYPVIKQKYHITDERLKKALLFKAETVLFAEEYLHNNQAAVFFENKEMLII